MHQRLLDAQDLWLDFPHRIDVRQQIGFVRALKRAEILDRIVIPVRAELMHSRAPGRALGCEPVAVDESSDLQHLGHGR